RKGPAPPRVAVRRRQAPWDGRMPDPKLKRQGAAEGVPDDVRPLKPQCPDEAGEGVRVEGHPKGRRRDRRAPAPGRVPGHHSVLICELELTPPHAVVPEEAMQEDHGWPPALPLI